jgi:hypothetical protein
MSKLKSEKIEIIIDSVPNMDVAFLHAMAQAEEMMEDREEPYYDVVLQSVKYHQGYDVKQFSYMFEVKW